MRKTTVTQYRGGVFQHPDIQRRSLFISAVLGREPRKENNGIGRL
jgi:hypothetical protein